MFIIPCVARFFVGYDAELLALTSRAFRLYALSFLIMGFNVYASSFFTALGDGVTSALISFLRTLAVSGGAILLLPLLLGIDGIWLAVTAAELAALAVSAAMLLTKDKVFHYRKGAGPAASCSRRRSSGRQSGSWKRGTRRPGRALIAAKALLPQPWLTPGRNAGGLCNGPGGVGGAGQGRVQDLIDADTAGFGAFAQLPGLGRPFSVRGLSVMPQILFSTFQTVSPWRVK